MSSKASTQHGQCRQGHSTTETQQLWQGRAHKRSGWCEGREAEGAHGCLQHSPNVPREAGQAALSPAQPLSPQERVTRRRDGRAWYNMCNTWRPQAPRREKRKLAGDKGTWLFWLTWCLPNTGENEQELRMINWEPRMCSRRMQAQPATRFPVTVTTDPDNFLLVIFTDLICETYHWQKSANTLQQLHPFADSHYSVIKTRTF